MSDTNTTSRSLKGPVDNVSYSYGSDTNLDESEDLLPSNQRTDNPNEGRLLKYCTLILKFSCFELVYESGLIKT